VPMIEDMRALLLRLRSSAPNEGNNHPVMRVRECQKSMDRAAEIVGMIRITHHDLRHYFASVFNVEGADLVVHRH